ncbi:hypothetical protein T439DRAFT_330261 [Meredithblackwellia eburnea MCA 4105]
MSYVLPTVPAGANAWTVYIEALSSGFYNHPSAGFAARMYVLWAVLIYCAIASVAYTSLLIVDHKRKGRKWWLWKTVKRPSGSYIALNQHALCSFGCIISSCLLWGYVYSEYDLLVNKVSPNTSLIFRIWIWIPVWFQGYLISMASLQAYIITSEGVSEGVSIMSAPVANGIFLGVGGALLVEMIVCCTLCTIRWRKFFHSYETLLTFMQAAEKEWTGAFDLATVAKVGPLYADLTKNYAPFVITQRAVTCSYVVAPASLVLLNLGAIRLIITLRRQIAYNLSRRGQASTNGFTPMTNSQATGKLSVGSSAIPNTPTSPNMSYPPSSPKIDFDPSESKNSAVSDATNNTGFTWAPTSSGHTGLLSPFKPRKKPSGNQSEREKVLYSLQRAEAELVIVCTATIFLCLFFTGISIWTVIAALSIVIAWVPLEMTVFSVPWAWGAVIAVTLTLLCQHVLRSLLRKTPVISVSAPENASPKPKQLPTYVPNYPTSPTTPHTAVSMEMGVSSYEPEKTPVATLTLNQGVSDQDYWKSQHEQWNSEPKESA